MKKTKVIIPALGILLLSTAASVTGTVAWFTAANEVDVSGMNFKAMSEQAMVVANEGKSQWLNKGVEASHDGANTSFISTSTSDMGTWYYGNSASANHGQVNVSYQTLTKTEPASGESNSGIGTATLAGATDPSNIFLINRFYVQSASAQVLENQDIYVKNLSVEGASTNAVLDASLRIGFVFGEVKQIFAPVSGATLKYCVNVANFSEAATYDVNDVVRYGGTLYKCTTAVTEAGEFNSDNWGALADGDYDVHAIADTASGVVLTSEEDAAEGITIPKYNDTGVGSLEFTVYIWFEGEDANHKSANVLGEMDNLSVSFLLGNKDHE